MSKEELKELIRRDREIKKYLSRGLSIETARKMAEPDVLPHIGGEFPRQERQPLLHEERPVGHVYDENFFV